MTFFNAYYKNEDKLNTIAPGEVKIIYTNSLTLVSCIENSLSELLINN